MKVPDFECFIIRRSAEIPAVGRPAHVADAELVAADRLLVLAVLPAPHFHRLVGG